jgi:acetyl esterase/lipase
LADGFFSRRIVYAVPGMERIQARRDIAYKAVDAGSLEMDIYLPPGPKEKLFPAVILVHGDAPPEVLRNAKDWGVFVSWGQLMAASSMAGIAFNHRSTKGRTMLAEAASDVDDLVSYVREHATELLVDPDRIGLVVFSMGPPVGLHGLLPDPPSFMRCVAVYYGAMDLVPLRDETPPEVPNGVLEAFSPVRVMERSDGPFPPILLARAGREERPWINPSLDGFARTAMSRGAEVDVLHHPTGHHAFDLLDDDARSQDIIARTVEFLRSRLVGDPHAGRSSPGRTEDMVRHLGDLRSGTFEGATARPERIRLFERGVELLDPIVRTILEEANEAFLTGTGKVEHEPSRWMPRARRKLVGSCPGRSSGMRRTSGRAGPSSRFRSSRGSRRPSPIPICAGRGRGTGRFRW